MSQEEFGLKRVLGLRDVVAVEIGQTIGAGVFVLTGLAMASSGGSLPLAYIIAVVPFIFAYGALAMLGSAMPTTGGTYHYVSRLFCPTWGFVGIWGYVAGALLGAFPLYALGCAKYMQAIWPALPTVPTAACLLTVLFVANLFGMALAAVVQALAVVVLLVALAAFVILGVPHVAAANLAPLLPKGVGGLLMASALLTFTQAGANAVVELGGEIKEPERVIPRSFLFSVPIVTVFYVLIGLVAAGVRPWGQSAGQPLTAVAAAFMGRGAFAFFVLGGGVLAILTTLNASFMWGTKSLMKMAADGWFPRRLADVSRRFGTPHWFLTIIWAVSMVALVAMGEAYLDVFASLAAIGSMVIFLPVMGAALALRKRAPEAYAAAPFKLKGAWYHVAPGVGIVFSLATMAMLLGDLLGKPRGGLFGGLFLAWLAVGWVYALWRGRSGIRHHGLPTAGC